MKYYSTSNRNHQVSFREAVFKSLPPDNGLYFPETIPRLDAHTLKYLPNHSLESIGFEMMKPFVGSEIPEDRLDSIVQETLDFDIPLREVEANIHVLELFHGPTWAFKDVGARFLARCMGYFTQQTGEEIEILVATSGDTGGAVAAGFHGVPGTHVTILFPENKVSKVQEQQLTSWGDNISALAVKGTFDDCQALVKQAFLDEDLNQKLNLSSANSINVARFLPQSMYYAQIAREKGGHSLVVAVPSGNYGNLTAGLVGWKMGLPIRQFIAASNINKVVPDYLQSAKYEPRPSISTYSNAMDVGAPSNFVRMLEIFGGSHQEMTEMVKGFYMDDDQTLTSMNACYNASHYLPDPHGVIAYQALKKYLNDGETGIFLETAHPVKFQNVVDKALDQPVSFQRKVESLMAKPSEFKTIENHFEAFKSLLLY
jgi:threonine synthase